MASIGEVSDYKVHPIYDALDSHNNKLALQICNKHLKKQPDALILLGLKALALERMGHRNESKQLCEQVKKAMPTNEAVLQALALVYRSTGDYNDLTEVYANAFNKLPNNEELANHYFMGLVRTDQLKECQQLAIKLNKTFKSDNNRYLFWTVMAIYLQAKKAPTATQPLLFTLAERMMTKAHSDNLITNVEALWLYLDILTHQKKYKEALDLVNGEVGALFKVESERRRVKIELLTHLEDWKQVCAIAVEILEDNGNDWQGYLHYLKSTKHLVDQKDSEQTAAKALEYIQQIQKKMSTSKRVPRGPFIAELHHAKTFQQVKQVPTIMEHYFDKFGALYCCFDDLEPYCDLIKDESEKINLVKKLLTKIGKLDVNNKSASVENIKRMVNVCKIEFRLQHGYSTLSADKYLEKANHYLSLYKESIPFGADLHEKERQHGDDYLVLSIHILHDLFTRTQNMRYIYQAIAVGEYGLQKSLYNFQIKLLLIRMYLRIGVSERVIDHVTTLDMKHVQRDTLSYLYVDYLDMLGRPEEMLDFCNSTLSIYKSNTRETPEMLCQAYKFGTYSKIEEFMRFRDRLSHSIQRCITQRQALLTHLSSKSYDYGSIQSIVENISELDVNYSDTYLSSLSDNRDFAVFSTWHGPQKASMEKVTRPLKNGKSKVWLQYSALVSLIMKAVVGGDEKVKDILSEWKKSVDLKSDESKEARLIEENVKVLESVVDAIVEARASLTAGDKQPSLASLPKLSKLLKDMLPRLKVGTNAYLTFTTFNKFSSVAYALEAFAFATFGILALARVYESKTSKKAAHPSKVQFLAELVREVKTSMTDLKTFLVEIRDKVAKEHTEQIVEEMFFSKKDSEVQNIDFIRNKEDSELLLDVVDECKKSWELSLNGFIEEVTKKIVVLN